MNVFSVESLSCADIITDILILIQLITDGHLWWTTFSILFIISPYLVSYTAIGTMLQNKFKLNIVSVIAMTPLCTIYFLIIYYYRFESILINFLLIELI